MKTYVFSLIFEEWSSIEIIKASNVEEAINKIKEDIREYFEIHSIYSE